MKIKELKEELNKFDDENEVTVMINFEEVDIKSVDGSIEDGAYLEVESY